MLLNNIKSINNTRTINTSVNSYKKYKEEKLQKNLILIRYFKWVTQKKEKKNLNMIKYSIITTAFWVLIKFNL